MDLALLSEQQLRDRARALQFDANGAVNDQTREHSKKALLTVEAELRRRYAEEHRVKVGITRLFSRLLGIDTKKAERHLRSVGRDEI